MGFELVFSIAGSEGYRWMLTDLYPFHGPMVVHSYQNPPKDDPLVPTRHPIGNQLGWIDSYTQKGNGVRMRQAFPDHSHLAKGLWDP